MPLPHVTLTGGASEFTFYMYLGFSCGHFSQVARKEIELRAARVGRRRNLDRKRARGQPGEQKCSCEVGGHLQVAMDAGPSLFGLRLGLPTGHSCAAARPVADSLQDGEV